MTARDPQRRCNGAVSRQAIGPDPSSKRGSCLTALVLSLLVLACMSSCATESQLVAKYASEVIPYPDPQGLLEEKIWSNGEWELWSGSDGVLRFPENYEVYAKRSGTTQSMYKIESIEQLPISIRRIDRESDVLEIASLQTHPVYGFERRSFEILGPDSINRLGSRVALGDCSGSLWNKKAVDWERGVYEVDEAVARILLAFPRTTERSAGLWNYWRVVVIKAGAKSIGLGILLDQFLDDGRHSWSISIFKDSEVKLVD